MATCTCRVVVVMSTWLRVCVCVCGWCLCVSVCVCVACVVWCGVVWRGVVHMCVCVCPLKPNGPPAQPTPSGPTFGLCGPAPSYPMVRHCGRPPPTQATPAGPTCGLCGPAPSCPMVRQCGQPPQAQRLACAAQPLHAPWSASAASPLKPISPGTGPATGRRHWPKAFK